MTRFCVYVHVICITLNGKIVIRILLWKRSICSLFPFLKKLRRLLQEKYWWYGCFRQGSSHQGNTSHSVRSPLVWKFICRQLSFHYSIVIDWNLKRRGEGCSMDWLHNSNLCCLNWILRRHLEYWPSSVKPLSSIFFLLFASSWTWLAFYRHVLDIRLRFKMANRRFNPSLSGMLSGWLLLEKRKLDVKWSKQADCSILLVLFYTAFCRLLVSLSTSHLSIGKCPFFVWCERDVERA